MNNLVILISVIAMILILLYAGDQLGGIANLIASLVGDIYTGVTPKMLRNTYLELELHSTDSGQCSDQTISYSCPPKVAGLDQVDYCSVVKEVHLSSTGALSSVSEISIVQPGQTYTGCQIRPGSSTYYFRFYARDYTLHYVGNGICETVLGESCENSPGDCGSCTPVPPIPPVPSKSILDMIISGFSGLWQWLVSIFSWFPASITGSTSVLSGTTNNYIMDMSTPAIDKDWTDGTYQVQYAAWALYDSGQHAVQNSDWERINETYHKEVSLKLDDLGDYALVSVVIRYDMVFNSATGQWSQGTEQLVSKEAIKIKVTSTTPPEPVTPDISQFFAGIIASIRSWFCSAIGWLC